MSAPLSGIAQQQVPLTQPFQSGGADQSREVRQREQAPQENQIQAREAPAAEAQKSDVADNTFKENLNDISASAQDSSENTRDRGTVVDVTV